jgi:hypothetical protein
MEVELPHTLCIILLNRGLGTTSTKNSRSGSKQLHRPTTTTHKLASVRYLGYPGSSKLGVLTYTEPLASKCQFQSFYWVLGSDACGMVFDC